MNAILVCYCYSQVIEFCYIFKWHVLMYHSTCNCCSKLESTPGNWLTPWSRVLCEKLIVTQIVKKFPALYRTEGSLPCSHGLPLAPLLSQMNPFHTFPSCLPKIHSNIVLPPTPISSEWSFPSCFPNKTLYAFLVLSMRATSLVYFILHDFDHPNSIWWNVQVVKLLIMQSSPVSRHPVSVRSKYSPQYPIFEHPISVLFP